MGGGPLMFITSFRLIFNHKIIVLHKDLLLRPNHANIMEVPRWCERIVVPKAHPEQKTYTT